MADEPLWDVSEVFVNKAACSRANANSCTLGKRLPGSLLRALKTTSSTVVGSVGTCLHKLGGVMLRCWLHSARTGPWKGAVPQSHS